MKAIIYCNPNSIFALRQAQFYAKKGIDFWIITYHPFKELEASVYEDILPKECFINLRKSHRSLNYLYNLCISISERLFGRSFDKNKRLRTALDIAISNYSLKRIKPDFIFGHNLFSYGRLVGNAPKEIKKSIMPYGADIYQIDKNDKRFSGLVKDLDKIDLFIPSAEYAKDLMMEKFLIPSHKIKPVSWGVDLSRFSGKDKKTSRKLVLKYLGLDENDNRKIVLNIRRFRLAWGSKEVLEAMKLLSANKVEFIGILVGGYRDDIEFYKNSQEEVKSNTLYRNNINFLDNHVEQELFDNIINSADIFLSILKVEDMRSSSILEGLAANAIPVISKCEEYSFMEKLGFKAIYTSLDISDIAKKIELAICHSDPNTFLAANVNYLVKHEAIENQQEKLLRVAIP